MNYRKKHYWKKALADLSKTGLEHDMENCESGDLFMIGVDKDGYVIDFCGDINYASRPNCPYEYVGLFHTGSFSESIASRLSAVHYDTPDEDGNCDARTKYESAEQCRYIIAVLESFGLPIAAIKGYGKSAVINAANRLKEHYEDSVMEITENDRFCSIRIYPKSDQTQ